MAGPETVYAIHNFVAENQDEIAFSIGEPIIVLEKDEGYNDGWWQGRNQRGEIGLFPANYTSPEPPVTPKPTPASTFNEYSQSPQLPTPSTSTSTKKSREALPRTNSISSLNSTQSQSVQTTTTRPPGAVGGGVGGGPKQTQKLLEAALRHPQLSGNVPEDWNVDQVAIWLQAMGFESVADNFKAQEITGDILLELNLEALKELEVNTFGKRFKIQSAINALREETSIGPVDQDPSQFNVEGAARSRTQLKADNDSISTLNSPQTAITNYGSVSSMSSSFSRDTRFQSIDSTASTRQRAIFDNGADRKLSISRKDLPRSASTLVKNQYTNASFVEGSANKRNTYNVQPSTTSNLIQQQAPKSRQELVRSSFSPTSKMQTVIPAPTRASVDSLAQRSAMPDVMPDMEGWLNKQGDKYKTWNRRWFVLKGPNLFYFKSPKDVRMKGIINLRGYRIICDETIYAGKYCFKAQHERERTFYFYTETEDSLRGWIKALMKATIARDFAAPVLSSSTIPTVSLDIARRMKPRPPSMILYKRETRPQSPSNESVDMRPFSLQDRHQPITTHVSFEAEQRSMSPTRNLADAQQTRESGVTVYDDEQLPRDTSTAVSSLAESKHYDLQDSGFDSAAVNTGPSSSSVYVTPSSPNGHIFYDLEEEDEDLIDPQHGDVLASNRPGGLKRLTEESRLSSEPEHLWRTSDYIDWINRCVDHKISELSDFRSGEVLLQLLETLSGKEIRRPSGSANSAMRMFDSIATAFKFMGREGVDVDGRYTIKDVFNGNEEKIKQMLDAIRSWSNTLRDDKKASGGTFGEQEQEQLKSLDISGSHIHTLYDDNIVH